jgi:hypothetical protein
MEQTDKITEEIDSYGGWRSERLRELRALINKTAPEMEEEFKWDVPVWTHNGLVCAISGFKDHVKMNFFKGAFLDDPSKLFNSGLDSKEHRSINWGEHDPVDTQALQNLIFSAVHYNSTK